MKDSLFWNLYGRIIYFLIKRAKPYQKLNRDIIKNLGLEEGQKILDAGCGPGYQILAINSLINKNIVIEGLDSSASMLRIAKINCRYLNNLQLKKADLNSRLEYRNSFFDRILLVNVLYTLKDSRLILRDIFRILKKGGILVIADPRPNAKIYRIFISHLKETPLDIFIILLVFPVVALFNLIIFARERKNIYNFYSDKEFKDLLKEIGFINTKITTTYANQDWLIVAQK